MGYNSVADNMGLTFIHSAAAASQICEVPWNSERIRTLAGQVIQSHRSWYQSKAHKRLPI